MSETGEAVQCFMRRFVPNGVAALMGSYCAPLRPFQGRAQSMLWRGDPGSVDCAFTGPNGHVLMIEAAGDDHDTRNLWYYDSELRLIASHFEPVGIDPNWLCHGVVGERAAWLLGWHFEHDGSSTTPQQICRIELPGLRVSNELQLRDRRIRDFAVDFTANVLYVATRDRCSSVNYVLCLDGNTLQRKWEVSVPKHVQGDIHCDLVHITLVGTSTLCLASTIEIDAQQHGSLYRVAIPPDRSKPNDSDWDFVIRHEFPRGHYRSLVAVAPAGADLDHVVLFHSDPQFGCLESIVFNINPALEENATAAVRSGRRKLKRARIAPSAVGRFVYQDRITLSNAAGEKEGLNLYEPMGAPLNLWPSADGRGLRTITQIATSPEGRDWRQALVLS
jgi:hypothetical protein